MKRVLMIAYHFPPLTGSSGIQRTLRFARYLPEFGWEPIVLTTNVGAYERVSHDLDADVPEGMVIERALAFDAARQLSIRGRYFGWLARPDRWMSWRWFAVRAGMRLIRSLRPAAVWSTYPIATAHVIGASLARRSGLPWIADFRDPMAQEGYPADPKTLKSFKAVEEATIRGARTSVFTTPGSARMYRERYPARAEAIEVIENGYDEESFSPLDVATLSRQPLNPGAITLLHSGIVYPSERDPTRLFEALRRLADAQVVEPAKFKLRFRAAGHDSTLIDLVRKYRVEGFVEFLPPIDYRAALEEMLRADALLVLQASNCNEQIPAKLYEYFRARRPIVALTDPAGDTAATVRRVGIDTIAPLDSAHLIAALIERVLVDVHSRRMMLPDSAMVARASRRARTAELFAILDRVAMNGRPG